MTRLGNDESSTYADYLLFDNAGFVPPAPHPLWIVALSRAYYRLQNWGSSPQRDIGSGPKPHFLSEAC
ncbi:hypothetical protein AUG19_08945 [archaeon 13_1_20CM_2_54_9]|nr:MAG: hypothetical protein AUJ07_01930 [Crenarchaeota archaeon 13_1_40CM_3_53_5]OLE74353.1 MAG: hypothetical protein AUG19_08945 [archaeon 13_1_20CM_2_54_9]